MSTDNSINIDHEKQIEAVKKKLAPPPMYKVLLNNDDYTPMDFVIEVLIRFFNMDLEMMSLALISCAFNL